MSQNEPFYFNKEEPNKGCLLTLRDIILKQDENITETKKYGMPCFCYKKKAFVYLWVDKKTTEPYILFVEGTHLYHPELEEGKRSRMKILRVNPAVDIPMQKLTSLLQTALDLYRKGMVS
ncbi:DUF1801 domain-containing protein [Maribacter sp.]|uniref:DUF1801 domain-containing protein n=1 Tax=Maribacter sp. TaxID=1897614 RepID=UPI0025C33715|nr:DUF1801 domain-containing protein [Maribacter sp.]